MTLETLYEDRGTFDMTKNLWIPTDEDEEEIENGHANKCPICTTEIVHQGRCSYCPSCGWSACSV